VIDFSLQRFMSAIAMSMIAMSTLAMAQVPASNSLLPSRQTSQCPVQNCKQWTEEKVCFMGYEPKYNEGLKQLAYQRTCGWDAVSFQTRTPEELRSAISELGRKCVKIKTFTMASHGAPGAVYLMAPPARPITVANLKDTLGMIGCWTKPGAEIIASGCNVGAGCQGDNFLYQTATQLLPQGGKVRGPTNYSLTLLPGILPVMSLDGNKAQITYDPLKNPPMTWQNRAEFFGTETPRAVTNQQCLTEISTTARALGPSGAMSGICSNQTDQQRTSREVIEIIARIQGLPANRFPAANFVPVASRLQALQGGVYAGSICAPQNTIGVQLPPTVTRSGNQ